MRDGYSNQLTDSELQHEIFMSHVNLLYVTY